MPRDVYYQSSGNPLQRSLLPTKSLELQFAHKTPHWKVRIKVLLSSLSAVCFTAILIATTSIGFALLTKFFVSGVIFVTAGIWLFNTSNAWFEFIKIHSLHFVPVVAVIAIIGVLAAGFHPSKIAMVLLLSNALFARELARHFSFVKTAAPYPVEKAWQKRVAVENRIVVFAVPIVVAAVCIAFEQSAFKAIVAMLAVAMSMLLSSGVNLASAGANSMSALSSWLTYGYQQASAPGLLKSPAGTLSQRVLITAIVLTCNSAAVMCIVAVNAQLPFLLHVPEGSPSIVGEVVSFLSFFLMAALATVLSLILTIALATVAVGPAVEPITDDRDNMSGELSDFKMIRSLVLDSENKIERESFYAGKLIADGSPLLIPKKVLEEHVHFLGSSGSGKTSKGLCPLIEQILEDKAASLMVLDLKGDSTELLQTVNAGLGGSKDSLMKNIKFFSSLQDEASFAFNPFGSRLWQRLNETQRTDVLCGAMGLIYGTGYGAGYFSAANQEILQTIMFHFPKVASFGDLAEKVKVVCGPRANKYGIDRETQKAGNHVGMILKRLASFPAINVTNSDSPSNKVLENQIEPASLFEQREVHYYKLPAAAGPSNAPEIARLACLMLINAATLVEKREQRVHLIIDEFQRMASPTLDFLLQQGRSMGISVILANQSIDDLQDSGTLLAAVKENCRYRQWFSLSSLEEQQALSKASGETIDSLTALTQTKSENSTDTSVSTAVSSREFVAPRLTTNDIKLASDNPKHSIVLLSRSAGYAQYGGMPLVVESDFYISKTEYESRRKAPWPAGVEGSFIPSEWAGCQNTKKSDTEETHKNIEIGDCSLDFSITGDISQIRTETPVVEDSNPFKNYLKKNPFDFSQEETEDENDSQ